MALSALAQPTRLDVFQLLVRHMPDGLAAGEIARMLGVPHNTLSTHLTILSQAGLATHQRHSRQIIYRANLARIEALLQFLIQNCCQHNPDLCLPPSTQPPPCCPDLIEGRG